jgi:hypothetical protein
MITEIGFPLFSRPTLSFEWPEVWVQDEDFQHACALGLIVKGGRILWAEDVAMNHADKTDFSLLHDVCLLQMKGARETAAGCKALSLLRGQPASVCSSAARRILLAAKPQPAAVQQQLFYMQHNRSNKADCQRKAGCGFVNRKKKSFGLPEEDTSVRSGCMPVSREAAYWYAAGMDTGVHRGWILVSSGNGYWYAERLHTGMRREWILVSSGSGCW